MSHTCLGAEAGGSGEGGDPADRSVPQAATNAKATKTETNRIAVTLCHANVAFRARLDVAYGVRHTIHPRRSGTRRRSELPGHRAGCGGSALSSPLTITA